MLPVCVSDHRVFFDLLVSDCGCPLWICSIVRFMNVTRPATVKDRPIFLSTFGPKLQCFLTLCEICEHILVIITKSSHSQIRSVCNIKYDSWKHFCTITTELFGFKLKECSVERSSFGLFFLQSLLNFNVYSVKKRFRCAFITQVNNNNPPG